MITSNNFSMSMGALALILTTVFLTASIMADNMRAAEDYEMSEFLKEGQGRINSRVVTACGGVLKVSDRENPVIDYKSSVQYGDNERCVWTFIPVKDVDLQFMVLYVELEHFTNSYDGLIFYHLDPEGSLQATRLTKEDTGITLTFPTQHAFLYFSSDTSGTSLGFKVLVLGLKGSGSGQEGGKKQEAFAYISQSYSDFLSYPRFPACTYEDDVQVSIVLTYGSVNTATNLVVDFLETEEDIDFLQVFNLPFYANATTNMDLQGRYSGSHVSGIPETTATKNPRILIFSSNANTTGRGFSVKWF